MSEESRALYIAGVLVLVPLSALLSGLTLGLLSLDPLTLQALAQGGGSDQRRAARLLPLVGRTHQVREPALVNNSSE